MIAFAEMKTGKRAFGNRKAVMRTENIAGVAYGIADSYAMLVTAAVWRHPCAYGGLNKRDGYTKLYNARKRMALTEAGW